MVNNRLLIIAVIMILFGVIGIAMTAAFAPYQGYGRMSPMMGMMGQGMMNRDQMREMMQRMMPGMVPPGIKPDDLPDPKSDGAKLLNRYCTQCHSLPSPAMHTAEEWPQVVGRMFARISMMSGMMGIDNPSAEEQQTILAYLKTHSMKSISPGSLPSPDSQGAILFKDICSQCHSLPDPKLHSADEWSKVVERMKNNMQTMGKKAIADQERKEIVDYLSRNARK